MTRIVLWFYSWKEAIRIVRSARRKKHGGGRLQWWLVWPLIRCVRYITYHQFYK